MPKYYLPFIYAYFPPYNIQVKQNILHNFTRYGDNAKQHRFYYILNRAVCFFPYVDRLFFIMIMNRLHCQVECLNVSAWSAEAITGLFPFQQWKQLPLGHEIIGIVKGLLLFVFIQ